MAERNITCRIQDGAEIKIKKSVRHSWDKTWIAVSQEAAIKEGSTEEDRRQARGTM